MQLLQAWAESLTLLKPQNFKPFLLVTLKSIIETYKILFTKFWPVIVGPIVLLGFMYGIDALAVSSNLYFILLGLFGLNIFAWHMLVYLCARPSVGIKDWKYISHYGRHLIWFWLMAFINALIGGLLNRDLFFIFFVFNMGFLLDSDADIISGIKSAQRAAKMFLYNIPFLIITVVPFLCLITIISYIASFFIPVLSPYSRVGEILFSMLAFPFLICFYINFYVKKKHEQFNLYFPVKGQ